jgi:hypothetical protein
MVRLGAAAVLAACALGVACDRGDLIGNESAERCDIPFSEYSVGRSFEGNQLETRLTTCSRRPVVSYIYGTCEAESDQGCAPPLEVQTWSACHRRPPRRSRPGDLEFRRGETTVVIFAHSRAMGRRAKQVLRKVRRPDLSARATQKLRACGAR